MRERLQALMQFVALVCKRGKLLGRGAKPFSCGVHVGQLAVVTSKLLFRLLLDLHRLSVFREKGWRQVGLEQLLLVERDRITDPFLAVGTWSHTSG